MFDGFVEDRIETSGATIRVRYGGTGPAVLLLHGNPQTSAMWRHVAAHLKDRFTLICPDLRGYGLSSKPPAGPDHVNYSKRAMAQDMVEVMDSLGHRDFFLCGHDRGGRVAHRLAYDHADRVKKLCVLDIAPTREMYANTSDEIARAYWHWFFMILPAPEPERMMQADPDAFWLARCAKNGTDLFDEALDEYLTTFRDPETIRATCDDYRAAASIDIAHDDAESRKLPMPVHCLWGANGVIERCFDPLALWRLRAETATGRSLSTGHYMAEEAPDEIADELAGFFQ
jgi:haloacetate dehalogenase